MSAIELSGDSRSHLMAVLAALTRAGWSILSAPEGGSIIRNGQLIAMRSGDSEVRVRLFVYKVTGSGRAKPDERRIEITSTYQKGLPRPRGFSDVVLGYDTVSDVFVGVDPKRIEHGGQTGNASSFFDRDGLSGCQPDSILIRPRNARLFPGGLEFHAFLRPTRLAEYLFNFRNIHDGSYAGGGAFSGPAPSVSTPSLTAARAGGDQLILGGRPYRKVRKRIVQSLLDSFERGDIEALHRMCLGPEALLELKRQMEENGRLGEEFVLNTERRALRRAGRPDLAAKVKWVSQSSVFAGYDISSFEPSGRPKWIEVKATSGTHRVFEMSDHEWRTACRAGPKYYIYRVTSVRATPSLEVVRDPRALERSGSITKTASGWRVRLS